VVVGAGLMGRWHADAIARSGGVVAGVVDRDPAQAGALARKHRGALSATSLEDVVAVARPHVVHVCTPLDTHETLARQALEFGANVLVEKPLAPDTESTRRLLALAGERKLLLCPVHQFPLQAGARRAREALARIGGVLHVDAVACSAGASRESGPGKDAVATEILPHLLSLLAFYLGGPPALRAATWHVDRPRDGEWRVSGRVGPATISMLVSMAGRPTVNSVRLIGDRGTVHIDLYHGYVVEEGGTVSRLHKIAHPFLLAGNTFVVAGRNLIGRALRREPAYPGLRELVSRVYATIRGELPVPIPPDEVLTIAMVRDKLIAQAMTA
jgi:predicted dehydrogenase